MKKPCTDLVQGFSFKLNFGKHRNFGNFAHPITITLI
jgi:hypothetical protein